MKVNTSSLRIFLASLGIILCFIGIYNEASIIINPEHKGTLCSLSATFDCSKAALSPYAKFLGIPTAAWGASFYLSMIILEGSPALLFLFSAIAVLVSFYLFYISTTILGAICPICFSQYITNILIFIVSFSGLSKFSNLFSEVRALCGVRILRAVVVVIGSLCFLTGFYWYMRSAHERSVDQSGMKAFIAEWRNAPSYDMNIETTGILKDFIKGPVDGKVTVVEFLDFECPACRAVSSGFRPLYEAKKDRVRLVYRNLPLDKACNPSIPQEMHRHACFTAEIARCAGEQGKYWEAAELLLELPLDGTGPLFQADILTKVKQAITLDGEALNSCMRSHRQMDAIKADIKLADSLSIMGTPTFYVNGRRAPSNAPEVVNAIVEDALKQP